MRRRVVTAAYAFDKQFSTILGRPPLILWQYCDIEAPVHLSWEDVVSSPEVREVALQRLDGQGWDPDGVIDDGACSKVDLLFFRIRENILTLSLSPRLEGLSEKAR